MYYRDDDRQVNLVRYALPGWCRRDAYGTSLALLFFTFSMDLLFRTPERAVLTAALACYMKKRDGLTKDALRVCTRRTRSRDAFRSCRSDSHRRQVYTIRHLYKDQQEIETDISGLLSLPGIARCDTHQSVQVDQTTLVGEPLPSLPRRANSDQRRIRSVVGGLLQGSPATTRETRPHRSQHRETPTCCQVISLSAHPAIPQQGYVVTTLTSEWRG